MEKINVAELLKDCPKGMELDCTMFEGLEFDGIADNGHLPIRCHRKIPKGGYAVYNFTKYGCWIDTDFAKCVIFPKGKTTWEGFVPPCKFKVGDKVLYYGNPVFITQIEWIADSVSYHFYYNGKELMLPSKHLQPYKEETMEEIIKIDIPKGYEFAGVDDDNQQVVFEKIGYQYPKTYEECCDVLGLPYMQLGVVGYACEKLVYLQRLLLCRDAYWKIAGEQMGFGKSWEPNWKDTSQSKHSIWFNNEGICIKSNRISYAVQHILTFPTSEIRDTFYENFKELINETKELL